MKDDVDEALEWLRFHKEKDSNTAARNKALKEKGEEYEIIEEDPEPDDPDIEVNAEIDAEIVAEILEEGPEPNDPGIEANAARGAVRLSTSSLPPGQRLSPLV